MLQLKYYCYYWQKNAIKKDETKKSAIKKNATNKNATKKDSGSHCEVYLRPQDATFVYEMNVFKLSLYFSHFFQMQMLRRFGIVTHC